MNFIENLKNLIHLLRNLGEKVDQLKMAIGHLEVNLITQKQSSQIQDYEFTVFSQSGEDGIIQFLIQNCKISRPTFVEFGVEDYKESNTRFLLTNNNWSGLVIDSSQKHLQKIEKESFFWRHNLKTECAFVTKKNINELIQKNEINGKIGLLSIDIDGNDYWIWDAIQVIEPDIVVIEYNSRLGSEKAVTIPYTENFSREKAHHSRIYFGASLKALHLLAKKKGYIFVGCNSLGQNAFFVRQTAMGGKVKEVSLDKGFVSGQFRECRNKNDQLTFAGREEEHRILSTMPFEEVL